MKTIRFAELHKFGAGRRSGICQAECARLGIDYQGARRLIMAEMVNEPAREKRRALKAAR